MKSGSIPALSICLLLSVPSPGRAEIPQDCEPWLARLTKQTEASREAASKAFRDGTRESQCAWIRMAREVNTDGKRFTRHCFRDFPEIMTSELAEFDEKLRSLDLRKAGCGPASQANMKAQSPLVSRCRSLFRNSATMSDRMSEATAAVKAENTPVARCRLAKSMLAFAASLRRADKVCAPMIKVANAEDWARIDRGVETATDQKRKYCK